MLRHLAAIVWLRWRLLANTLKGGKRRDTFEQISRALALAVPLVIVALSMGSVIALSVVGFLGGRAVAGALAPLAVTELIVRGVLLAALLLTLVFTVLSPAQSALAQYTRLLLLPIQRRVLHLIEVLANFADPWLLFAAVTMLAFAAGLVAGGRPVAAFTTVLATLILLFLLAATASLVSFVVAALVRNRRRGEIFTLVFILAISVAGMIPAFLAQDLENRRDADRREGGGRPTRDYTAEQFDADLPAWTRVIPTELAGRAIGDALRGNSSAVAIGLTLLALETFLIFTASSAAHRRLIESIDSGRSRRRSADADAVTVRVPLLSPAASVVAWAQFKPAIRSLRGRLAVLIPGPMLALLSVLVRGDDESGPIRYIAEHGYLVAGMGLVFSIYTIQPFSVNMFGIDRAGLTLQFLSPLRDRDLAWGKVAGCGMLFAAAGVLAIAGAVVINPTGSPLLWLSVLMGAAATYLLVSPFAVWFSTFFPVAADMSKSGSGGNPHPISMFGSLFLVLLIGAPAALILAAGALWWKEPALTAAVMAGWLACAAIVTIPLIRLAARAIGPRRENLLLVAQRR